MSPVNQTWLAYGTEGFSALADVHPLIKMPGRLLNTV